MKVDTEKLKSQAYELQRFAFRADSIQESVLHITNRLAQEQFGEEFRPALLRVLGEGEQYIADLQALSRALQLISGAYERVEQRIVEETEFGSVHRERLQPRLIRLPQLLWPTGPQRNAAAGMGVTGAIDWTPWDPAADST